MDSTGGRAVPIHRESSLRLAASVVTIGTFDGVHRGHQKLIRETVDRARRLRLPSVVYTFDTPPKAFFGRAEALIPLSVKLDRICAFEPDHLVVARFDKDYAARPAAEFLAEIDDLKPRQVVIGSDFRFGSCKTGTVDLLRDHFDTVVIAPVRCDDGEVVSSSRIRSLRRSGRMAAAAALEGWKLAAVPLDGPNRLGLGSIAP